MPDPSELLAVARLLADPHASQPPPDAQLRRAVSTAYYAVFHTVLRAGAGRLMGAGTEARSGYALIYRAYNHGRIRAVCAALNAVPLGASLQRQLHATAISQEMRDFASGFLALHEYRHRADYDPHVALTHLDAIELVGQAETAIQAFERTTVDERADVLALMLVGTRD